MTVTEQYEADASSLKYLSALLQLLFTCVRGATAAATGNTGGSSGCCGSDRPLWVSSSERSRVLLTLLHSAKDGNSLDSQTNDVKYK